MKNILASCTIVLILFLLPSSVVSQTTNIISYNIKYDNKGDAINNWNDRKASLVKLVQHYETDILGIQEGLHRQVDYLDSALPNYDYVGVGRDDGKSKGEYTAIFYKRDKFKVLQSETFWLSDTPEKVSVGWDASMERICTYALMENVATKKQFWVFNTHFDHIGTLARANSAQLIYKKITEINTKNLAVVLMGDLNLSPEEAPIQYLKNYLTDAQEVSEKPFYGPVGTFNGFDLNKIVDQRIDYIFVQNLQVLSYVHIDDKLDNNKHISDHYPVLVTIVNP
ncbi:endonuclease/exonuclease/phosphatase family protein [Arenibacter sp. 6A1]|uniref:endonuclease/exonuclease/phosphatase family protein n=1 Tax=Arenibacter sp. 6A1 TaxID=2720391 RepID=UPI0014489F21|nr:endonuclease/exonuclease/phosphatase family protein [Arenibacter sp. 6A1]NKI27194.1 endonuclease/exonuclease/phosphatase family protein [Arenibacter sp. 6A1]